MSGSAQGASSVWSVLPGRVTSGARAQAVYTALLEELLEGDLQPDDWLSVVDIAERMACSRAPVMEAIKRLASEGFVTIFPQVGCRVTMPNPAEVGDFFRVFAAVEGCVARLAAERRTAVDLEEFELAWTQMARLLRNAGGPTASDPVYRRTNILFHKQIHRMAHGHSASQIAAALWERSDFYIKVAFGSLYFSRRVKDAHESIRNAIIEGDPDIAESALVEHLRTVGVEVSRRLRELSSC